MSAGASPGESARVRAGESLAGPRDAASSNHLPPPELVLVRYGELALKGGNRQQFESALCRNIARQTRGLARVQLERRQGRLLVIPTERVEEVARRLQEVFGIKSVSPVWRCSADPEAIVELARAVLFDALAGIPEGAKVRFRVETKRADKTFPVSSHEFDRRVAERVLSGLTNIKVDLDEAELTLGIDIREEGTYVFARRYPGPGGLPVGTQGRGLCLLSGGIDSPVAAWMAMKRGLSMSFVTFHSYPYIGEASKRKVIDLVRELARWQTSSRLYVVPFAEIQVAIRDTAPESYRTILYRRMMQRIATRIANAYGLTALVTGESLGQVASQTLENMTCIGAASGLFLLRPVVGFDKDEIIATARRIGTFDISNRQEPDCCTVFMPQRPVIRGKLAICEGVESELDVEGLLERALAGVEKFDVEPEV